jgi:hypothetical protein
MRFCLRELALDKEPRVGVTRELPNMRTSNRSLVTAEPVSAHGKRKLEKSEQRPAPETRVQSSEMPQIADQRPVPACQTCGNVDAFPFWGTYYAETELYG